MAMDVFVHALFGVQLEEEDQKLMAQLVEKFAENPLDEDGEPLDDGESLSGCDLSELACRLDLQPDQVVERISAANKGVLKQLRAKYDAPEDTIFVLTDSDDDIPGRAATPGNSWLLGYGLYHFPSFEPPPVDFCRRSKWHAWATGG